MTNTKPVRRTVPAKLMESTPDRRGLGHWALASPMIIYAGWLAVDIFAALSPIPWRWLDLILGTLLYVFLIVLPAGVLAHGLITAFPRLFQQSGWDVIPLERRRPGEDLPGSATIMSSANGPPQLGPGCWLRAAQGWVYLEIYRHLRRGHPHDPPFLKRHRVRVWSIVQNITTRTRIHKINEKFCVICASRG